MIRLNFRTDLRNRSSGGDIWHGGAGEAVQRLSWPEEPLGSRSAPLLALCRWLVDHGVGMASEGRDRLNRWRQSPVWQIGSVAIFGLVIASVFVIRSLTASNGGTAPAAPAEERAAVEGDESLVDGPDGTSAGDRPNEGISDLPVLPEEPTESSSSYSSEPEVIDEQPATDIDTGDDEVQRPPEPEAIDERPDIDIDTDDGEVQRPPEPEVVDEQPDQVTTTAEPSDTVLVGEENGTEFEVGVGSPMSWGTGTGWIVPWGDGILEVGWLKIGEERNGNGIYDETQLVARSLLNSSDCQSIRPISEAVDYQNCWGELNHYLIPNTGGSIAAIISDGERLIVAFQMDKQAYISVTGDLIDWDTTEISLPHPPSLPDFVYAISHVDHLAISPNGWLLKITTEFTIDILVQAGVKEPRTELSIYDLRKELDDITVTYEDGVQIRWWTDEERSDLMEQFFTWEDLGFDLDMFDKYYSPQGNKPYVFPENIKGSVWTATWEGDPMRIDLPDIVGDTCCAIVGTAAGYLAISDPGAPGYDPTWFGPAEAFFSQDGQRWVPIDSPSEVFLNIWAVKNGVVASSVPVRSDDQLSGSNWDNIHWWLSDSDGSNWREIEGLPQPPMLSPFQYPTIRLATGLAVESHSE